MIVLGLVAADAHGARDRARRGRHPRARGRGGRDRDPGAGHDGPHARAGPAAARLIAVAATPIVLVAPSPLAQVTVIAIGAAIGRLVLEGRLAARDAAGAHAGLDSAPDAGRRSEAIGARDRVPRRSSSGSQVLAAVTGEPGPRPGRRLRPGGRARVRWRPRRAAAARRGRRPAGLGDGGRSSSPGTAPRRRCRGRCSRSPATSARCRRSGPAASPARLVALVAIFLPGALLVLAALPVVGWLRGRPGVESALAGVNAAVVGILAAALISPVMTGALTSPLGGRRRRPGGGPAARRAGAAAGRGRRQRRGDGLAGSDGAERRGPPRHAPGSGGRGHPGGHEERRTIREGTGPCGVRPAAGPVTGAAAALDSLVR